MGSCQDALLVSDTANKQVLLPGSDIAGCDVWARFPTGPGGSWQAWEERSHFITG